MGGRSRIDDDKLRKLWSAGHTCEDIAAVFDVTGSAVSARARNLELPKRKPGGRTRKKEPAKAKADPKPLPDMPEHPFFTVHHDKRILEAGGRYAALSALAAEWGKPVSLLLQRQHRLGAA